MYPGCCAVHRIAAEVPAYRKKMGEDEYHEALLERIRVLQREITDLPHRDALSYAYLVSRDMPEEAARMLVAEMLLDYWARSNRPAGSKA